MGTPVVLITGALTGIGRAAARAFAQEGHRTVVAGRHEEAGQKLVTELCALGTEAEFFRTDVRHENEVRNLVDRTVRRHRRPARSGDAADRRYQRCRWPCLVGEDLLAIQPVCAAAKTAAQPRSSDQSGQRRSPVRQGLLRRAAVIIVPQRVPRFV